MGALHSTKNSGNFGWGIEWDRHFPKFHSENFGCTSRSWPKIREKQNNRGKFRSIRPFLLGPSFSENRIHMADHKASKYNYNSALSDKQLIELKHVTSTLLQWIDLNKH